MKKATISKNIERVREATESTQSLRETVGSMSQTLKRNPDLVNRAEVERNVKRAKTSLISSMSELRKAQDTLRKNLGAKKSQLSEYLK
jgi:conjugal transfer/entry exclusion protein